MQVHIIDVILIVSLILSGDSYNESGDVNEDEQLNVVDIVQLVNIILNN